MSDSINDLDGLYGRTPLQSGGGAASSGFRINAGGIEQPLSPYPPPAGPPTQIMRQPVGTTRGGALTPGMQAANAAQAAHSKSGGRIDRAIIAGMPMQQAPQPNPMNVTKGLTPDSGVLGPETYHTSQGSTMLDRAGRVDQGGYSASKFRYDRAMKSGKGLDAARQEYEGYKPGTQVQLHGGSASGNVITSGIVPGAARIPQSQERAMMPGLIETGVNVPHRTSQGLSPDRGTALNEIEQIRNYSMMSGGFASSGPGGANPRLSDLQGIEPKDYAAQFNAPSGPNPMSPIVPPGVEQGVAPKARRK